MQNFLATLAQISATLLGIFAAGGIAYFVFLNERITTFSEQAAAIQVDIATSLDQLKSAWPQGWGHFVPPQFLDRYRAKYPTKTDAALVVQLGTDLLFQGNALTDLIKQDVLPQYQDDPWNGRLYLFFLAQVGQVISESPPSVFPAAPSGPGFDHWRNDFKQIRGIAQILRPYQSDFMADFQPYVRDEPYATQTRQLAIASIPELFTVLDSVQSKIDQLDKLALISQRYNPNRQLWFSVLVASALWLVVGVILPLILLAFPNYNISTLSAQAIVAAVVIFGGVAVFQATSGLRQKPFDESAYIRLRWLSPIFETLTKQDVRALANGGLVDARPAADALNSNDNGQLSAPVSDALTSYLNFATRYNDLVPQFSNMVVSSIREDPVVGPLTQGYTSQKGGVLLYPYQLVDGANFQQLLDAWGKNLPNSNSDISMEMLGPNWSQVLLKIPGAKLYQDPTSAKNAFNRIRARVLANGTTATLVQAKGAVEASSAQLQGVLKQESGR